MQNKVNIKRYNVDLQKLASTFNSGNIYLDKFLREPYSLDDSYGKTYVILSDTNNEIIGYFNIGTGYIEQADYGMNRKIGGSVHINCLAIAKKYQRRMQKKSDETLSIIASEVLLDECLKIIEYIREKYVGFAFITLMATKEGYNLYKRNGFEELDDDLNFSAGDSEAECKPMYMVLDFV